MAGVQPRSFCSKAKLINTLPLTISLPLPLPLPLTTPLPKMIEPNLESTSEWTDKSRPLVSLEMLWSTRSKLGSMEKGSGSIRLEELTGLSRMVWRICCSCWSCWSASLIGWSTCSWRKSSARLSLISAWTSFWLWRSISCWCWW